MNLDVGDFIELKQRIHATAAVAECQELVAAVTENDVQRLTIGSHAQ